MIHLGIFFKHLGCISSSFYCLTVDIFNVDIKTGATKQNNKALLRRVIFSSLQMSPPAGESSSPHLFISQLLAFVWFFVFHGSAVPQNKETPRATHPGLVLDVPREGDGVVRYLFHFGDGVEAFFVISCRNKNK